MKREHFSEPKKRSKQLPMLCFSALMAVLILGASVWILRQYRARQAAAAANERYQQEMGGNANTAFSIPVIETKQAPDGHSFYVNDGVELPQRPDFFANSEFIYNGKHYRRNTAVKAYLLLGVDVRSPLMSERPFEDIGLTDAIFVLAHNTSNNTVKLLQVPRDSIAKLQTTDEEGNLGDFRWFNITYQWVYGDGKEKSAELSRQAISWLLGGLPIQGYMAGGIGLIETLTDYVGGVEVRFENDDLININPEYTAGSTTILKGKDAERFVRYRDTNVAFTAMDRMIRQRQFILSFEKRLLERQKKDGNTISEMFELIQNNMITSMDKGEYLRLAMDMAAAGALTEESFMVLPGENVEGERFDEFYPDEPGVDEQILHLFYREEA